MGVYSTNRYQVSGINVDDIVANESYAGELGIQKMIIESHENDMAIFEAILKNDIQETIMVKEGALLESELASLNEASLTGIWESIKQIVIKFWEKVQAIFKSFREKVLKAIEDANKKLLDDIKGKIDKKDLSKFTYEWREDKDFKPDFDAIDQRRIAARNDFDAVGDKESATEVINRINNNQLLEDMLGTVIHDSSATAKNFAELFDKKCFGEATKVTGGDKLPKLIEALKTGISADKQILKKNEENVKKTVKDLLKEIEDNRKKSNDNAEVAGKVAEGCRLVVNAWKTASLMTISGQMKAIKFAAAQNRSVVMKAWMFNPKAVKESTELFDAIDEVVAYEIEEMAMCY